MDPWLRTGSWKNRVILAHWEVIWFFCHISAPEVSWHQRAPTCKVGLLPPSLLQERGEWGKARLHWIPQALGPDLFPGSQGSFTDTCVILLDLSYRGSWGGALACMWDGEVQKWGVAVMSAAVVPWCHLCPWHSVLERGLHKLPEVSRNCNNAGLGTQIIVLSSPNVFALTPAFKDISAQYGNTLFCDQKKKH